MKTLKKNNLILLMLVVVLSMSNPMYAMSKYTQTVRGTVIDQDTKLSIIGANVIILNTSPILGASSGIDGSFRIEDVPLGRVDLQITYLGYETKLISNLLIGSSKEIILNIELQESIVKMDDITITGGRQRHESLNKMASVSAKAFSVEETKRYAGALNDPARMVSAYAGVTGDATGNNDIVVRGNSPKGILWRLDDIEIPNPNHFANEGSTGGPINALNSTMLANSDFFSGAFAPEYGNAYSGVFDMKLRSGNNEQREYSATLGVLGIESTLEGPFKKGYAGSYLVNYRYSSLTILDNLNIIDYDGIPKYQDISFKIALPTQKAGSFSLFGIGGMSSIKVKDVDEEDETITYSQGENSASLGMVGLNHLYQLSPRTFAKSFISVSGTKNQTIFNKPDDEDMMQKVFVNKFINSSIKLGTSVSTKFNARNRVKAGLIYNSMTYDNSSAEDYSQTGTITPRLNAQGDAGLLQAYVNWRYRISDQLSMVSGVHNMHFLFNNSNSIEPRLGFNYQYSPKQSFSMGFGIHSKVETISTYYALVEQNDGSYTTPNTDLDFAKSAHFVLGYGNQLSENIHLKIEAYYQHLYDVAVENDMNSAFVLNNYYESWVTKDLVNNGSGRNYGAEFTLERFYQNNFYYLATASLYQSKYTAMDGIERDSRFNGNYAANFLLGKEFRIGEKSKNKTLSVNTKISLIGGQMYTPLDLQASIAANENKFNDDLYFAVKGDDIFQVNLGITYRRNRKNTTHEFKVDIQNLTNNQAKVLEYYNDRTQEVEYAYQLAMLPNIMYTIYF